MVQRSLHVCYWGNSGRHLLLASISPFGPGRVETFFVSQTLHVELQTRLAARSEVAMLVVENGASVILTAFEEVRSGLIGKAVVLTDGKAGTVENVWLDESHGLRISVSGHDGKWPASTIKFTQSG
jgi:hypothetical protein